MWNHTRTIYLLELNKSPNSIYNGLKLSNNQKISPNQSLSLPIVISSGKKKKKKKGVPKGTAECESRGKLKHCKSGAFTPPFIGEATHFIIGKGEAEGEREEKKKQRSGSS